MTQPRWRKSSFSGGYGECVDVAWDPRSRSVAVRHSADTDSPILYFTPAEWRAFTKGVRAGEFDYGEGT